MRIAGSKSATIAERQWLVLSWRMKAAAWRRLRGLSGGRVRLWASEKHFQAA